MNHLLSFSPKKSSLEIKHGNKIVLIGSCFSSSMNYHFSSSGFKTLSNPFGTIFHPLALANALESAITNSTNVDVFQRDDLYFSWDSASLIYAKSQRELIENVINSRRNTMGFLKSASVLIVTFGTSWGYIHNELNDVVANCHKAPAVTFSKELSSVQYMADRWKALLEKLAALNPELQIIFTVSPVRHIKDGLVENNRSKARLIELAHDLSASIGADYFPSYELVIDQLRDYRYYNEDLVHPSDQAVMYVWNFFRATFFPDETELLSDKVFGINRSLSHVPLHPDSKGSTSHVILTQQAKDQLTIIHPEIYWA